MERFIRAHEGIYGSLQDGSVGAGNVIIRDQISFSHPITAINVDSLITQNSLSHCRSTLNTLRASSTRLSNGSPAGTEERAAGLFIPVNKKEIEVKIVQNTEKIGLYVAQLRSVGLDLV